MSKKGKHVVPSEQATVIRPSKKQRELLSFIEGFVAEHGYGPSYREIMRGCDYKSVSTVAVHVDGLIARGHLLKKDHSARSLEVVKTSGAGETKVAIVISKSQEKWMVDIVNLKFDEYEARPSVKRYDGLCILVGALSVLGMDEAAIAAKSRLSSLSGLQSEKNTVK